MTRPTATSSMAVGASDRPDEVRAEREVDRGEHVSGPVGATLRLADSPVRVNLLLWSTMGGGARSPPRPPMPTIAYAHPIVWAVLINRGVGPRSPRPSTTSP